MQRKELMTGSGTVVYWMTEPIDHTKDTMFLLHGLTADHTMFDAQTEYFRKDYNVIAWDAPAHGESRPFHGFTYRIAADCVKQILDDNGIAEAILIGQSMGGFISQSVLGLYPECVKAFVSIDSTPYGDYYSRSDQWWLRQVEWMAMLYPLKMLKSAMAKQTAMTEKGRSNMKAMLAPYGKKELCHLMGIGFAGFLDNNRELEIPCPVLLIVGEKDRTGKVLRYNKEWTRRTGYPLIYIRNAAHNANTDNPEAVNDAITSFLERIA
ncbi:MAG: alpha/beta hydrolase [Solobacterium sp.]|nr:alpha/beta hydrolase [Solobacterium sp.]